MGPVLGIRVPHKASGSHLVMLSLSELPPFLDLTYTKMFLHTHLALLKMISWARVKHSQVHCTNRHASTYLIKDQA